MIYHHSFNLQCSHFNGRHTYDVFWELMSRTDRIPGHVLISKDALRVLLADIHGHNFTVDVTIGGDMDAEADWLIEDEELTSIVMAYNDTNLSVHPDLMKQGSRVTTERFARILCDKIVSRWPVTATVRVWETPSIYAEASGYSLATE